MAEENELPSSNAWITGRETWPESFDYGEMVVPEINIWERPGSLPRGGQVVGRLPHGTGVSVMERTWDEENKVYYYRISGNEIQGWVEEVFLSWEWSCFTFLGSLKPTLSCMNLETSLEFRGMNLLLKQNGYAVVVEGNPSKFDSIQTAVSRFLRRVLVALASVTSTPLQAEPTNWVEVPLHLDKPRTVGFTALKEPPWTITNDDIQAAYGVIPLMASVPYLDLALSDYYQAMDYPQHALIFLARALESIENHFSSIAKQRKDAGKEQVMRELLGVHKSDVDYVTKRANASHRRHATSDGRVSPLPKDELTECFQKTANIIIAFVDFLKASGF
jgi:hypothetical protein